jgi:CheY-like chemotaxis protein
MDAAVTELVKIIPAILWFALAVFVLVLFYRPIRDELLPYLSTVKAGGVELSFVADSMDAAVELAEKSPQWKVEVPAAAKRQALARVKRHRKLLRGSRLLWVDDHPGNNGNEVCMFRRLGVEIDQAESTETALKHLREARYDLVVSDMARGAEADAGLGFLAELRKSDLITPVVFYVGVFDPGRGTPATALGITNRPDELVHFTLDALERHKS